MIKVAQFTFNPFMENTYVLYDETAEGIIIDPGCYTTPEKQKLTNFIEEEGIKVVHLINTHCHIDHVLGNKFISEKYELPVETTEQEVPLLTSVQEYAPAYGFNYEPSPAPEPTLKEGGTVTFGSSELGILFVPGHSPGHIALTDREQKIVIGGDVLFQGGIGRTDLPGGDHETLIRSIREKMLPLGDDWRVYPGHGPSTTIGEEKGHNPFLQ